MRPNRCHYQGKAACEVSGHAVSDHFVDINKMVDLGSGSHGISVMPDSLTPHESFPAV